MGKYRTNFDAVALPAPHEYFLLSYIIAIFAVEFYVVSFYIMACTTGFIDFVLDTLAPLGEVRARKMMGDYVIYLDEKCVITACDNIAYIKKHPCIDDLMAGAEVGCAYEGAKESYILNLEDKVLVQKVISTLWHALPFPKSKKK